MAYSEVQYPSQHCAVRPQQFQSDMQYYQGVPSRFQAVNENKSWFPNEDHNANSNFHHENNYQRLSPPGQALSTMWNPINQGQYLNMNVFNGKSAPPANNVNKYGQNDGYRQRINSAASDGYAASSSNQWMSAQSPNMYSLTNQFNFPRSRQGSMTDQGQLTPDNYYHTQQNYNNQCMPQHMPYRATSTPGSCGTNSPPNMSIMPPQPTPTQMQQPSQVPTGEVPIPGKRGSDWELECMGVEMKLSNANVWKNFDNVVTEMVISKHGRRMFPVLEYELNGLDPNKLYNVFLDFVLANCYVWKYVDQGWHPNGLAANEEPDFQPGQRVYLHPDSPAPGDVWNKKGASFNKMKLSNHYHEKEKIITLRTLHKYQPRLHIVEVDHVNPSMQSNLRTFVLPKTTFMTVTLYHDTDVAQLKINLNPFARSFRDKSLTKKPSDDSNSSNSSSMSQSLSPMTSPENVENSVHDIGDNEPINFDANEIVKVENPVNSVDLEKAKQFLHKQLNVMSQLVRTSEELERNSTLQSIGSTSQTQLTVSKQGSSNPSETLEELLKPQTVHHFAPPSESKTATQERKQQPPQTGDSLENYQLLNLDRCFPPNAVAASREKLPFDPKQLNDSRKETNQSLPAFYGCSYYREQAAAAARNVTANQNNDTSGDSTNLPVVYVPTGTNPATQQTSSERHQSVSSPQPSPVACFTSPNRQQPLQMTLPTLSPGCLRDILQSDDISDSFAISLKRKRCFDGINDDADDDVFSNSPPAFDFMQMQAKRSCFDAI